MNLTLSKALATLACVAAFAAPAGAMTCEDFVDNNVYSCQLKSDFGTEFQDCFRFTSPGAVSLDFDLAVDGLGQTLACDCKAKGSFKSPKFGESKEFNCVSLPGDFIGIAFSGKATAKNLKKGQVVSDFGDSFVFECVPDPACGAILMSPPAAGGNPYTRR